jgi:hypothetical protein
VGWAWEDDFARRSRVGVADSGAERGSAIFFLSGVEGACTMPDAESAAALFEASCEMGATAACAITD